MKKLLLFVLAGIVASTVFLSCKDKFNEESFLRLQARLKRAADSAKAAQQAAIDAAKLTSGATAATTAQTAQVAALNSAGQLAGLNIQILEDKTPLAGVTVALTNTGAAAAAASATATTDANGNAVFANVAIGGVTVTLTKTGYATSEVNLNLGSIEQNKNYVITSTPGPSGVNYNQIVPIKQTVSAVLPMYATTGTTSLATIKGNVFIETDVTNLPVEIPQGLTLLGQIAIAANVASSNVAASISGNSGSTAANNPSIAAYTFSSGSLGTAAVNATTGAYSMSVPASAVGVTVDVVAPTISANQTMWVNSVGQGTSSSATTRLKLTNIPAVFDFGTNGGIPVVAGASLSVSAPPASGVGFSLTPTAISRALPTSLNVSFTSSNNQSDMTVVTADKGTYAQPPTVTVGASTPAGSTPALAGPSMKFWAVGAGAGNNQLTITNPGAVYGAAQAFTITIQYTKSKLDASPLAPVDVDLPGPITGVTDGAGLLPAVITFNAPSAGSGQGFASAATTTGDAVTAYKWKLVVAGVTQPATPAVVANVFNSELAGLNIYPGTAKYTAAAPPTFTIGSGTADFKVLEFRTQWSLAPANASTTPYKVLPQKVEQVFAATAYDAGAAATSTITALLAGGGTATYDWITQGVNPSVLTTDGTNLVSVLPAATTFRTATFSAVAPTTKITIPTPKSAAVTFATRVINTGTLAATGAGLSSGGTIEFVVVDGVVSTNSNGNGVGYDAAPVITINIPTGAPGTGAVAPIFPGTIDPVTKEFKATTAIVAGTGEAYTIPLTTKGSAYYVNLNRIVSTAGVNDVLAPGAGVLCKTGQTYIKNIRYSTGSRPDNVYN